MAVPAEKSIGSLYFFYGTESYLIDREVRSLQERVVDPGFRDFNLTVFYGNECRGEEISEAARTLPMFADRRMVIVRRADSLSAAALDILLPLVQDPSPSTCLVFAGEKIDQRKKFFTEFKKKGKLVEFKRPSDDQLHSFITGEAHAKAKRIAPEAVEMLTYLVGNNLAELASQVEKAALYAGAADTVTAAHVKAIVSDVRLDSVFELVDAVGRRELPKSLRALHTLLREGEAPLKIIGMLSRHFRQLWKVKEANAAGLGPAEAAAKAGIAPFFLRKAGEQAKNYSHENLRNVFRLLFEADLALKSSGSDHEVVMERLVAELCRGRWD